jgi:hypothetical protein
MGRVRMGRPVTSLATRSACVRARPLPQSAQNTMLAFELLDHFGMGNNRAASTAERGLV